MADKQPVQPEDPIDLKRLGQAFQEAQRRDGHVTMTGLSAMAKQPTFGGFRRIGLGV